MDIFAFALHIKAPELKRSPPSAGQPVAGKLVEYQKKCAQEPVAPRKDAAPFVVRGLNEMA